MPLVYEEAVTALNLCIVLDDAKEWSDKADALAAWARMYHHDEAGLAAKRLKLRAFLKMGELARELRPGKVGAVKGGPGRGTIPGPISLLLESGLKVHQANAVTAIAKIQKSTFEAIANSPRPPSPSALLTKFSAGTSSTWIKLSITAGGLFPFRRFCKCNAAIELAAALTVDEASKAREAARDIAEWVDEFEQHLPKIPDGKQ